jgi:hypothetical protein
MHSEIIKLLVCDNLNIGSIDVNLVALLNLNGELENFNEVG